MSRILSRTLPLLLLLVTVTAVCTLSSAWQTPDDGQEYDVDDLVDISGGAVTRDGEEYVVHEDLVVAASDTLKVGGGYVLRFQAGVSLVVRGGIQANGFPGFPVTFTSDATVKVPGYWGGVVLHSTLEDGSFLRHCRIEAANLGVHVLEVDVTAFDHMDLERCNYGLYLLGPSDSVAVSNSTFIDLDDRGVSCTDVDRVQVADCVFNGSSMMAIGASWGDLSTQAKVLVERITVNAAHGVYLTGAQSVVMGGSAVRTGSQTSLNLHGCNNVRVEDCALPSTSRSLWVVNSVGAMENISVQNQCVLVESHFKIDGLTTHGPSRLTLQEGTAVLDDVVLLNSTTYGVHVLDGAVVHIHNSTVLGSEDADVWVGDEAEVNLYDSVFGTYEFQGRPVKASLNAYHSVHVRTVDSGGAPIRNAIASVRNDAGEVDLQTRTGIDGWIVPRHVLSFNATPGGAFELAAPLRVNVTNGWLFNGSVVPTNTTIVLTFVLADVTAPTLRIVAPDRFDEDVPVTFSATTSTDDDPDLLATGSATWYVAGPDLDLVLTGFEVEVTAPTPGQISVNVVISDAAGNQALWVGGLQVLDVTPPDISINDLEVRMGDEAVLDAQLCTDNDVYFPGGARFDWTLRLPGGDVHLSGRVVRRVIDEPGDHQCTLDVTDASGNVGTADFRIDASDEVPPVADAGPDQEVLPGSTVTLDGTGSSDNYRVAAYTWLIHASLGVELEGARVEHTFEALGSFRVVLTVFDTMGNHASDEMYVKVASRVPVVTVTSPENGTRVEGTINVTGDVDSDFAANRLSHRVLSEEGVIVAWTAIDVGDGFTFPVDLSDAEPGVYMVEVRVSDGYQESGTVVLELVVPGAGGDGSDGGLGGTTLVIVGAVVAVAVAIAVVAVVMRRR